MAWKSRLSSDPEVAARQLLDRDKRDLAYGRALRAKQVAFDKRQHRQEIFLGVLGFIANGVVCALTVNFLPTIPATIALVGACTVLVALVQRHGLDQRIIEVTFGKLDGNDLVLFRQEDRREFWWGVRGSLGDNLRVLARLGLAPLWWFSIAALIGYWLLSPSSFILPIFAWQATIAVIVLYLSTAHSFRETVVGVRRDFDIGWLKFPSHKRFHYYDHNGRTSCNVSPIELPGVLHNVAHNCLLVQEDVCVQCMKKFQTADQRKAALKSEFWTMSKPAS